ncbi:hypothetical protein [Thermosyntropha lipolytica]|nr:hypothetical protein [Thermosyntropha lipolytica]
MVIFLILGWAAGCGSQGKNVPKKPAGEEKPKAPPALNKIIDDIDKINEELANKISKQPKKAGNENDAAKNNQEMTDNIGEGGGKGGKGDSSLSSKERGDEDYSKEEQLVKKMYKEWNLLEPDLVKAGIGNKERNDFRQGLDDLALAVQKKKREEALRAAIAMYKYYAGINKVFSGVVPPNFYLVKYEALSGAFFAAQGDFNQAEEHMESLFEYWNMLKMQKKADDAKLFNRTEFSLYDLQKAVENKEALLIPMKIEVVQNNLEEVEDSLSKM